MTLNIKYVIAGCVAIIFLVMLASTPVPKQIFEMLNASTSRQIQALNAQIAAEQQEYEQAMSRLELENVQLKAKLASIKRASQVAVRIEQLKGDQHALSEAFSALGHTNRIAKCE